MRTKLVILIGLLFNGIFLWFAVNDTEFTEIRTAIASAELLWAVPFLVLIFAFYWLKSQRWCDLLSPIKRLPTKDLFPTVMSGYAASALLPMQLGEFVRLYIAGKQFSLSYAAVLGSIAIERVFDFLTVLSLLCIVLLTGQSIPAYLVATGYFIAAACIVSIGIIFVFVAYTNLALRVVGALLIWVPEKLRQPLLHQIEITTHGFQSIKQPLLLGKIIFNSLLQWTLMGVCVQFSLIALDIQVPVAAVILVLVATVVGISLPTGPGYIGNIQLAFAIALKSYGASAGDVLAASLFYHVLAYAAVVPLGLFYLHGYGLKIGQVQKKAAASLPLT